jgi:hypothetical protein
VLSLTKLDCTVFARLRGLDRSPSLSSYCSRMSDEEYEYSEDESAGGGGSDGRDEVDHILVVSYVLKL